MKKILMVLSSQAEMQNTPTQTGVWLNTFTDPYYECYDEGFEVTLASPKGGRPPIDPMSEQPGQTTGSVARFYGDEDTQLAFGNTWKLEEVNAADFDALFYAGGHGPMWDLAHDAQSARLFLDFYDANKPIAMVCHGPAALIKVAELRPEILRGRRLTCFSNTEEALLKRHPYIPYPLKDRLKELGAEYNKGIIPFTPNVVMDGLLITGQNPLSAVAVAQTLVKELEGELIS